MYGVRRIVLISLMKIALKPDLLVLIVKSMDRLSYGFHERPNARIESN